MIKFNNVVKNFRRARVLDGISLDIGLGERVALIGSNGAGKTTLIRCLLGEYTHGGEIAIDGGSPRHPRLLRLLDHLPARRNSQRRLCGAGAVDGLAGAVLDRMGENVERSDVREGRATGEFKGFDVRR